MQTKNKIFFLLFMYMYLLIQNSIPKAVVSEKLWAQKFLTEPIWKK